MLALAQLARRVAVLPLLRIVKLPDTVATLGYAAFQGCKSLQEPKCQDVLSLVCEYSPNVVRWRVSVTLSMEAAILRLEPSSVNMLSKNVLN